MTGPMPPAAPPAPHATCGARLKTRPGELCPRAPMHGQKRCRMHGGAAPQARAAAERRQQEAAAHAYVARYGVSRQIEWHEAIPEGINEAYGNVLAMRDLVQSLAPEQLAWGRSEVAEILGSQFPGINTTYAAGLHPWVELYGQERDRLHRMAVDAGKLGLEVRKQQLAESQVQQIAENVVRLQSLLVASLGLEDRALEVRGVLVEWLRSLAGSGPLAVGA